MARKPPIQLFPNQTTAAKPRSRAAARGTRSKSQATQSPRPHPPAKASSATQATRPAAAVEVPSPQRTVKAEKRKATENEERIRAQNLPAESTARWLGRWFIFPSILSGAFAMAGVYYMASDWSRLANRTGAPLTLALLIVGLLFAAGMLYLGVAIYRLRPWAHAPALMCLYFWNFSAILSLVLSMLGFVGLLGYMIYADSQRGLNTHFEVELLSAFMSIFGAIVAIGVSRTLIHALRSPEGQRVFSPGYARIVALTPHVAKAMGKRVNYVVLTLGIVAVAVVVLAVVMAGSGWGLEQGR